MIEYTPEQVTEAADQLRTVADVPKCEAVMAPSTVPEDHLSMPLVVVERVVSFSSQRRITDSVAHELIGLGMVALADHGKLSLGRALAFGGNLLWEVEDFGEYPTPLEAVVAACVAVLPRKENK